MEMALTGLLAACVLLCELTVGAEGRSGQQNILLVRSEDTVYWFNDSSRDIYSAARLALEDYTTLTGSGSGSSPLVIDILLQETGALEDGLMLQLAVNQSVTAVINSECTSDTCLAVSSHGELPVISASPSCWWFSNSSITEKSEHRPLCMLPSLSHLPTGILGLMTNFNWTRASVLSDKRKSHLVLAEEDIVNKLNELKNLWEEAEIESESLSTSSPPTLNRDFRIVVINSSPDLARTVLCQGLRENLTRHVWLVPGWYPQYWWRRRSGEEETPSLDCTNRDLEQFLSQGGRLLSLLPTPPVCLGNKSRWVEFQERCEEEEFDDCLYAGFGYDAVWAVIHAINNSSSGDLYQSLGDITFSGVSGLVQFNTSSRVLGGYLLNQLRNSSGGKLRSVPVAILTQEGEEEREGGGGEGGLVLSYLPGESEETVWPDGVPHDGTPRKELKFHLIYLVAICYTLSGSVIVWAIWCILFNIIFRKKKIIKLTSPTMNMMIAVGIILINISVPLNIYPEIMEDPLFIFCTVRSLLLPVGWSLSLGTITVKMWRVFVVYRSTKKLRSLKKNRMKKFLQDKYMMALVFCMVTVDLFVLVIVLSVSSTRFSPGRVDDQEFPPYRDSEDIKVEYENLQCVSEKGLYWVALLFGYKIIFLFSGMILAVLSRKIEVKALNESREVQATMLITSPIVLGGLIVRLLLSNYFNVVGMVYGLSSSVYGILVLGIIFLPKMIALYKDPAGDKIYGSKMFPSSRAQSIDKKERSITNASLYSTDFTTSQRLLIRKTSEESGLGSSVIVQPEEETKIDKERPSTTLPTIRESVGSGSDGVKHHEVSDEAGSGGTVQSKSFVLHQGYGGSSGGRESALSEEENNPDNCLHNLYFNGETGKETSPESPPEVTTSRNSRTFVSMFDSSGVTEVTDTTDGQGEEERPESNQP